MKSLVLPLFLLLISANLLADEFIIKSFKKVNNKILTNKDKRYDDNDELCAIVLVRTSIVNLGISVNTNVVGNINRKEGDYWVYLSAGSRMIKFYKEGFETKEYIFPQRIEKGNFYLLELKYRRTDAVAAGNTMGFVVIESDPPGADVFINGEATSLQTPFQNPYNEGYYRFVLKKPYYEDYTGDFTILPGKTQQVQATLMPDYGSLQLNFNPGTDITINIGGKIWQQNSPLFIEKLKPGSHTLVLSKVTYDEYRQDFTITKGETTTLNIELIPDFGNLIVSTLPEVNAKVSIDGTEYPDPTPFSLEKLSPGQHHLRLNKKMYLTHEQDFTINKGENTDLQVSLKPNYANYTITANAGDSIFIDGQLKGTATCSAPLLKGTHIIEVKRKNYHPVSKQINIIPGNDLSETIELKPKTGTLSVMTTPIGADILLNGKLQGQSPMFINNLMVGTYSLKLQKEGWAPLEKQIIITESNTTTIKENLPDAVEVHISSVPPGAKLYVDGQYMGTTPLTISLSFESHSFKLQEKDYKDFQTNKKITANSTNLTFKLQLVLPPTIITGLGGIELIFVKGGTFQMGCAAAEQTLYHNYCSIMKSPCTW